ncbi:MAG: GNAT family N-acetyltransferase [Candidatus Heimdallarchaeota archaeon]|nr:GNAT family N-acetyltransferase [Candidatus Heimdallarchaeota archaeon]
MQFRDITYDDLGEIRNLQPEDWPDIVPEFEYYIRKIFCFPTKVMSNNKIVGVGTLIVFGNTAWLTHIIVDQDHRNSGIGFHITEKLINDGNNKSVKSFLLIATELGLPVYKKAGFRILSEYQYLNRDKPWKNFPLSPNIYPYEDVFDLRIYELDEKISGENRKSLLTDYLENTLVYIQDNSVSGFYMPGLGEGLIYASTAEAGLELMKIKYSKVDKAVLPGENHPGTNFLRQNGFTLSEAKGTRMILGQEIDWKPEHIYSRIGGNFG